MGAGIITGWVILFGVLFVCKANHIFELNKAQDENTKTCYDYGTIEREKNENETTLLKKSHYRKMLRRTFLMCF
ncbi:MAG: hypothetical protein ABXS91_04895 [Sulfurimonas sp.]